MLRVVGAAVVRAAVTTRTPLRLRVVVVEAVVAVMRVVVAMDVEAAVVVAEAQWRIRSPEWSSSSAR